MDELTYGPATFEGRPRLARRLSRGMLRLPPQRVALAVAAMGVVLVAPGLPDAIAFGTFRAYADGAVLIALLFGLSRVADGRAVPWSGT
ncbi:MAG: hypothetical protein AAF211_29585, partial [Myxococcota bacterium]